MVVSPFAQNICDETERIETERIAAMSPAERIALCLELCQLTESIVSGRPDADAIRAPHPRSPESLVLWQKLMQATSDGRRTP